MDESFSKIPNHVAIIVDGNGRWAKERGLARSRGHDAGFENLKRITKYIFSKNIKILSLYVFSTENFKRSKEEVDHLMNLFVKGFKMEAKTYQKENIKVVFSTSGSPLSSEIISLMKKIEEDTKNNTKGILNICINYGGRTEIVDATKKICQDVINNKLNLADLDEELYKKYLYQNLADVDLMIRTSGEKRLSNFLLYQNAYSEFYFPNVYFPDFDEKEFDKALIEYTKRDRRFGNAK